MSTSAAQPAANPRTTHLIALEPTVRQSAFGVCGPDDGPEAPNAAAVRVRGGSADLVGQGVDGDRGGEHEDHVEWIADLDAVRVADTEPLLGDLGDLITVAFDLVLVVDDVAVDLQVGTAVDLDDEPIA